MTGRSLTFCKKENRDKEWRIRGGKRSSIRNQLLDPRYVDDWDGDKTDRGLGNTKEWFTCLYILTPPDPYGWR